MRAYAIAGVVGGHWLVTGLVVAPDGGLRPASPLVAMPQGAPASWALQTLGLFFFAGGFAAARSRLSPVPSLSRPPASPARAGTPGRRSGIRRLVRPVALLGGALGVALAAGAAAGVPPTTLRTVASLVLDPLWFLLPYVGLTAATGWLSRATPAALTAAAALAVAIVAGSDAGCLPGLLAVPAAWAVPWLLGVAVARDQPPVSGREVSPSGAEGGNRAAHQTGCRAGRLAGCQAGCRAGRRAGRLAGALLATTGAAALTLLITLAHYPASAVGVPGAGRSNLSPPSLAAVALGVTQVGLFLLARPALDRPSRAVTALNRVALPVYLTHQSVLLAAALLLPAAPGLIGPPTDLEWVIHRAAWLPVFTLVLALLTRRAGGRGRQHADPRSLSRS